MFDLSLAHISHAEHERDLVADLRDRQVLKATSVDFVETAPAVAPDRVSTDRTPIDRPVARRHATGVRAVGRQG
jgi:hypothetical protein